MRRSLTVLMLMSCATAKPLERLERQDIQGAMLDHGEELAMCVEQELRRAPATHGKVLLHFRIQPSGEATELSTEGASSELDSCLRGVLTTMRFPEHRNAVPDPINWPMKF